MKRSFRVATIFTGTAAAAALAPAAHAAPMTVGNTAKVTPNIVGGNCPKSAFTPAVHLYYTKSENHPLPACFSGLGRYNFGKKIRFSAYCGGDWSGYLYITTSGEKFTPGGHHLFGQSLSAVSISTSASGGLCGNTPPN